jgi:succinoglycan biosynthesis transport protein ExoP
MDMHIDSHGASVAQAGPAQPTTGSPPSRASAQVRPQDVFRILQRNVLPITACALVGAVAAYAYTSTLEKSYTAYGAIAVEGERVAIPELQGALRTDASPDPMPYVRTEVQALGAHSLIVRLTNELHLDRDPQFNAELRPPSLLERVKNAAKALIPHGKNAMPLTTSDAVVNAASHALAISQDNRSLVIGVTFTAHDPRLAAAAVNRLISDYIAERMARRNNADHGANTEITHRIDQERTEISGLEKQMRDLRAQSGVIALRAGSVGQQQLEDLATEASKASLERSQIAANLARAQAAAATGSADELASVIDSPTISRLREQESQASGQAANLAARFGPSYPALRSAQADLAAVRGQLGSEANRIVASLTSQLGAAQAHEADVQAQLQTARRASAQAQDVQARLEQMQQDIGTRRALYGSLLQSAQQTVSQPQAEGLPGVRVLSDADVPGLPSAPNMKLAAGLGGIAGALLAGLLAFTRSATSQRFQSAAEIEAATGAVILTQLRGAGGLARWDRLADQVNAVGSAESAAMRQAHAMLRTGGRGGAARVVAFVGAANARLIAATAAAFARVAAHNGQSVLVLDTSFSNAGLARSLDLQPGLLADALLGAQDWRDCTMPDSASPAHVLLGRPNPAISVEKLRIGLENILAEARADYDLIVLCAAPADDTHEAPLVRTADATIMVINAAQARPTDTSALSARLATVSRARLNAIVVGLA